jgi:hypothetical protein
VPGGTEGLPIESPPIVASPTFFPAPAVPRSAPLGTPDRPLPLIIDSDPGLDDALAIGLAVARPELDLLAVTTVGGNADVHHCTENALRLLEAYGRADVPVAEGAAGPARLSGPPRSTARAASGGRSCRHRRRHPGLRGRSSSSPGSCVRRPHPSPSPRSARSRTSPSCCASTRGWPSGSPTSRSWAARSGRGT